jgi:hypothetical protein
MPSLRLSLGLCVGLAVSAALTGCAVENPAAQSSPGVIQGQVHGGQQPVTGATIQLYAVGATGDASAATPLLSSAVSTDQNGSFNISSLYTCPSSISEVYIVATGGNPGLPQGTNNTALSMMAALGQCGSLSSSTYIVINEVTTVGSLAALYPFMTSATHVGSGPSDAAQLASAFALVPEYVNIGNGTVPGLALPSGYSAPSRQIDTLGNIIAGCIDSSGGGAGDGSPCGNLFSLATPSAGQAPSNTIGALLDILSNPSQNVAGLFSLSGAIVPFQPSLPSAPSNWLLPVLPIYTVDGSVNLAGSCGGSTSIPPITVTLTQGNTVIRTTTTNSSGVYSFASVPNGTYTITPSIVGPTAIFSPATQNVVVSNNSVPSGSFSVTLGYTVSGTVSYSGAQSGQVYLTLIPLNCTGKGAEGTSISGPGTFTIHGVPPGSYTLQAFMDNQGSGNQGSGAPNASNPTGSTPGVVAWTADPTGVALTLHDPAAVTLSAGPTLTGISPFNGGVLAEFLPITNNGIELATYYTFQWSTDPEFATIAGTKGFPAIGTHTNFWFLKGLSAGNTYYFRAYATSSGTLQSPNSATIGPITIDPPSGANTVSGAISYTGSPIGPMFAGFLDQISGNFYGEYFKTPANPQGYTIQVPTGSNYLLLGFIDQNNEGVIDAGDIQNAGSSVVTAISGTTANLDLTLPSANSSATVTTQNLVSTTTTGSSQSYSLAFKVSPVIKRPVAVQLISGPNIVAPIDIGVCGGSGSGCGQGFYLSWALAGVAPNVGDSYTFAVTYSDGTSEDISAAVTAVPNAFATSLSPVTGSGANLTPTFSWTYPPNAANYTYQFDLSDANANTVWQIPAGNSKANGFTGAQIPLAQIPWNTDPSGGGSLPTPASGLSTNLNYTWQIEAIDSNGNSAVNQVQYQP